VQGRLIPPIMLLIVVTFTYSQSAAVVAECVMIASESSIISLRETHQMR